MKILVWNCRGLGNPQAVPASRLLVRQEKPELVCLKETKSSVGEVEFVKWKLGFRHCLGVVADERRGGLGLMWDDEMKVDIKVYNLNVKEDQWHFTLFYGDPVTSNRSCTWQILKDPIIMKGFPG